MIARPELVLAIYFQSPGFAFVLFQDRLNPIDWGAREIAGPARAKRSLKHVGALLALHTPDVLLLQDTSRRGTRRAPRIQALNSQTAQLAKQRGIPVRTYSRAQVLDYFKEFGATTKQSIAEAIAGDIPALSLYVPPPRKPWKSEDPRMGIFDATALAWMFIQSDNKA